MSAQYTTDWGKRGGSDNQREAAKRRWSKYNASGRWNKTVTTCQVCGKDDLDADIQPAYATEPFDEEIQVCKECRD